MSNLKKRAICIVISVLLLFIIPIFLQNISALEELPLGSISVEGAQYQQAIKSYTDNNSQKSCPCQPVTYNFYLKNTGNFIETYDLGIKGDVGSYAKSTIPSKFTMQPGQETSFKLIIQAPCEIYGTKKFSFIIKTEKLEVVYPLIYDILPCYSYDLEAGELINDLENFTSDSFIIHQGPYTLCENESKVLPIKITNNAAFTKEFNVRLIPNIPKNALLKVDYFSLDSAKSVILPLYVTVQQYDKTVSNSTLIFTSEKGKFKRYIDIEFNTIYCVTPLINISDSFTVNYTKTEREFYVTNQGNRKERYSINISALEWVKLSETEIFLDPKQSKTFIVIIDPNESIKSKTYNIKIKVKALSTGNLYSKEFSIKLTGRSFSDRIAFYIGKFYSTVKAPLELFFKYLWVIILFLLIVVILIFLIRQYTEFKKLEEIKQHKIKQKVVKKLKPEIKEELKESIAIEERPKKDKEEKIHPNIPLFASIGILVLLILALFFFKFPYSITTFIPNQSLELKEYKEAEAYEEPVIANTTKIPALIMDQDKQLIVNLTEYFYDPDNDELYFSSLVGENVTADINSHGIAILSPNRGFYGTSSIVFIADDGKGGTTQTNNITLIVRKSI